MWRACSPFECIISIYIRKVQLLISIKGIKHTPLEAKTIMKLLGWMHQKLQQTSGETLKEYSNIGQPLLDEQQYYYSNPNYCSRTLSKTQIENHLHKSVFRPEPAGEKKDLGEEPSSFSELFHGFLSIGTLGTDPIIVDPSTPISSISVEKLADERTEVTESELRLINEELVKVLRADRNDGSNDSSVTDRNSHANAGRRNQESTISLIGKPMEGAESSMKEPIICPLQGYLLSAEMGVPDTTVSKKEKRTSLGELFQKTKVAEENSGFSYKKTEKESDKSGMKFMKRLLKKKMIHDSSRSSTSSKENSDSAKAYKKRPKILRMFHRKVHPEISVEIDKLQVKNIMNEGINSDTDQMYPDITICPQRVLSKGTGPCKSRSNLPQGTDASDSQGNREHWIKTDTNYLVLEL